MRYRPKRHGLSPTIVGVAAVAVTALSAPASAQDPAPAPLRAEEPAVLERSLYKMLVFEAGTNALDLALFASVLGGHLYVGPTFLAVNATAAAAMYYGHEVVWGYLGPPTEEYDARTNILKGTTFRLASSTRAFAVGYGFTGDPIAAAGFTIFSAVGETVMYVANEYGWAFYDQLRQRSAAAAVKKTAVVPATFSAVPTW
ncbi:DUF2061 domain-containing protein [Thalassobaculum sp.]|uniref:DUF2061 domain-containing protein n=1 Tax=Thalassobaculum sp. TaxID=2022740 RepID=UPI0032EFC174